MDMMDSHLLPAAGKLAETVSPHRSRESRRSSEVCEEEAVRTQTNKELLLADTNSDNCIQCVCLFLNLPLKVSLITALSFGISTVLRLEQK